LSLYGYYTLNFQLMQHHNYSLTEIESMIPWEKEIYVTQLTNWLKEENQKLQRRNQEAEAKKLR